MESIERAPERLIASIQKSGRQQFRILLKDFNDGTVKVKIRVFERHRDHDWEAAATWMGSNPLCMMLDKASILRLDEIRQELINAGVALKAGYVTPQMALDWAEEMAPGCLGYIPPLSGLGINRSGGVE